MIGAMDRKAYFSNPEVTKSASGGTTNVFVLWGTYWIEYKKSGYQSGSRISGTGSQQNIVFDAVIKTWYSAVMETYLTKDTMITVGQVNYGILDFTIDSRNAIVEIKLVSRLKNSSNETYMNSILHTVTSPEVTDGYFTETPTINRTIITIETQRDMVVTIITSGTPSGAQIKHTASTGRFDVSSDAPLVAGEKFRIIYK